MIKIIDMKKTGKNIRELCSKNQISIAEIQKELHFNNPQSIYKWFHGKSLPSVDNLCILSIMLKVPIEAIIIFKDGALTENHMNNMIKWLGECAADSNLLKNTFGEVISMLLKKL